ncbi:fibronectin type III domain-containing protein [Galbibacter mesophilus]|uniref:hypothetical protein n=1 Tax=Galbibacter mesophilus TaxID=379069 RepID=UPI00191DDBD3|nr:hypothetical protein [Galbibacter mesophilus]MCM5662803.1 hypothetical protein [Galbibacter mesophilus]
MKKLILILIIFSHQACSKSDDNENGEAPSNPPEIMNLPPSIPNKVYPDNGLLCLDNPLEFKWNPSTDKEGDSIVYIIEIAKDEAFEKIVESREVSNSSLRLSLEKGIQFNWRVKAKDINGNYSDHSSVWKFYTEGEGIINYLPFTPELISPKAFSKVDNSMVNLIWSSSDVDQDSLTYDIYFGTIQPPPLLQENFETISYEISISSGKTYYWKIIAKDDNGGVSEGSVWVFKS